MMNLFEEQIISVYTNAAKVWRAQHEQGSVPHFWEVRVVLSAECCEGAARELLFDLDNRRQASHPQAASILLRYLLLTRLSNVNGNYLWPAVAKEMATLTGCDRGSVPWGNFFREALLQVHQAELPQVFQRYVAFLLGDTGVGFNRGALVRQFLRDLLDSYQARTPHATISAKEFVAEKIRAIPDSDLRNLTLVLENTGTIVIAMADYARDHEMPSLLLSSWAHVRNFWEKKLGIDLDHLLPEAEAIFSQIMHRFGSTISTDVMETLLDSGQVQWIAGVRPKPLPVGKVTVMMETKNIEVELMSGDRLRLRDYLAHPQQR
ncbi:MAG: hypothetical protein M1318_06745, partial [Firmicutes bacterium]|nr:hypothetical protein [Bacillota bacterium]